MKHGLAWGVSIAIAVACGVVGWRAFGPVTADAADPAPPLQVPVTTASAKTQDVPILLNGLGTVQPLNVVQIKAQVNGTLIALPVREGQEVHKDDIVAEIDPRPYKAALDQAMAQRDQDTALLQSAQQDLKRYQNLAKSNFAPVQQVDDQQATVNKQIGAVGVDNALIETAQINLGYCVIRAPFDGRVSFYQLNVGNVIQIASQSGIVSIVQDRPISVVFTLPEADLPRVQQAMAAGSVPVEVLDGSSQQHLANGTLLTPNNTIDTTTGTISMKAVFDNQDGHLWSGQFVNTKVQIGMLHHAVTVPTLAVQHGPEGTFVYTVKPDSTVAQVNVKTANEVSGQTVITDGLSGNETVVESGQSRVAPGVRVKAAAAAS